MNTPRGNAPPPVPPPHVVTPPHAQDQGARRPSESAPLAPATARPAHKEYPKETATTEEEEEKPATGRKGGTHGQLAVIIDDMGSSLQEARALAGIGLPVTFSIIPGLRHDREVADFAAQSGIETMIHIPMQSKGWPQRRLEANGLLLAMDDAAIREHMGDYALRIPRALGVNNHMGSEFTEHEDKMRTVLGVLKGRGLFFVDSVTTPQTVGLRLAREMGVKAGKRNVFLDNEQDGAYIRGQLGQAVRLAKRNGAAIAICHPHPATIATLAEALPTLAGQGITLVAVSRLVR
ncbi:divergent polysaccharide deacetylase family protein [Oryzomonas japonica]|uniref:Divergent polysaccharide deacetylase family protein n=2 Tax=Oryzomonas japonica TaxID=2603858 RepID=A0A7J4ZSB3_9BACT|nr:divergent polysaccharide deacetylase family protein [Oryzomonas japonica]